MTDFPDRNRSFVHSVAAVLAYYYLSFTGITTKLLNINRKAALELENNGKNFIYAIWHSRQVFPVYAHKNSGTCALVSRSKDGEYMAGILTKFGINSVRGSTSKGAPQALLELIEAAGKGFNIALTPDGPKGPGHKVQPGIIYLAQKTGVPIIPVSCALTRKLVFGSWDKFQIPLPFGKAAIAYGNPIYVTAGDVIENKTAELEKAIDRVTEQAETALQPDPCAAG